MISIGRPWPNPLKLSIAAMVGHRARPPGESGDQPDEPGLGVPPVPG